MNVFLLFATVMLVSRMHLAFGCGEYLRLNNGQIESPGFPDVYANALSCTWTIEVPSNMVVQLRIVSFDLRDSDECSEDYLVVYDGDIYEDMILLPPSCGQSITWPSHPTLLLSTGNIMTVMFVTDVTLNDPFSNDGFQANFQGVEPRDDFFLAVDADNRQIYKQNRFGINAEALPIVGLIRPVAVDFDPVEEKVYYTDVVADVVRRINVDGTNQENIATSLVLVPDGLAVDYMSRIVYWTDTGTDAIYVAKLDGTYRRALVNTLLYEPRAIAVLPDEGYIFWTDWGAFAKIERAFGDGQMRRSIVTTGLGWPNAVVVDRLDNKLYWADAKLNRFERCNFDGSIRELLMQSQNDNHPFGLVVLEEAIYWTDWGTGGIDVTDRNFENEPSTLYVAGISTRFHGLSHYNPTDLVFVDFDCSFGRLNSGCDELCLPVPSGMSCINALPIFQNCRRDTLHVFTKSQKVISWEEPSATSPSDGIDVTVTSTTAGRHQLTVPLFDMNITISYFAVDEFGNSATCSFNISVTYDKQPPAIENCPKDIAVTISSNETSANVDWEEPTAVDNYGAVELIEQSHQIGTEFFVGETEVTYTWQDGENNVASCVFSIIVDKRTDANGEHAIFRIMWISGGGLVIFNIAVIIGCLIWKCVQSSREYPCTKDSPTDNMYMIPITTEQIDKSMYQTNIHRSSAPYDLHPRHFRNNTDGPFPVYGRDNSIYHEITDQGEENTNSLAKHLQPTITDYSLIFHEYCTNGSTT